MQEFELSSQKRPVIERFALKMANGYKDIEFSAKHAVKILVAENGAGKTTLLNTMYYLLTGNYRGFISAYFEEFELSIGGVVWNYKRSAFAPITEDQYTEICKSEIWERLGLSIPELSDVEELVLAVLSGDETQIENSRYYQREANTPRLPSGYVKANLQSLLKKATFNSAQKNKLTFQRWSAKSRSRWVDIPLYTFQHTGE